MVPSDVMVKDVEDEDNPKGEDSSTQHDDSGIESELSEDADVSVESRVPEVEGRDDVEEVEAMAALEGIEHDANIEFSDSVGIPEGYDTYFHPKSFIRHLRAVCDLDSNARFLCGRAVSAGSVPGGTSTQPVCRQCMGVVP